MKEEDSRERLLPARTSLAWRVLWIALVAVIYFAAARLSLRFLFEPEGIAAIWPPSGIFLSAILLTRRSLRPYLAGVLLCTDFVAELLAGTPLVVSAVYALALAGEAVLSAWLLLRILGSPITFTRVRDVLGFLVLAAVLSNGLMSSVAAAASELLPGIHSFGNSWRWWAASDGVGNLLVTPFLLSWAAWAYGRQGAWNLERAIEGAALFIPMALLNLFTFSYLSKSSLFPLFLPYATFPFLLWAALRFGMVGVTSALLVLAAIAVPSAAAGRFAALSFQASPLDAVIAVQLYLAMTAVPSLFLAAVVTERRQTRAALRRAEERHRITLMSVGDAVITTDVRGRVELLNPVAEALTGWRQAEARGKTLEEVFHIIDEGTRRPTENLADRVIREGVAVGLANHTALIARDGTERPIADSGAPIRDERNEIIGVVLVFRDQTEERAAQKALRASEERFRRAVVEAPFPILLHAEDGAILQASRSWCEITGYAPEELRTIADWTERAYGERKESVRADIDALYGLNHRKYEGDYAVRTKDGARRIWEFSSAPLGRLPDGRRLVISMAADVTERREAEEELRRSEDQLKRAHRAARLGNWEWDLLTNGLYWSRENYSLHGIDPEKVKPSYEAFIQLVDPAERDFVTKTVVAALAEKRALDFDYTCTRPDNCEKCIINSRADVIVDSAGKAVKMVGTVQDVTAGRRAEAALRESEARFRTLADATFEGIAMTQEGVFVDVNDQLTEMLGYAREELVGQPVLKVIAPESREFVAEAIRTGRQEAYEHVARRRGGTTFPVEIRARFARVGARTLRISSVRDMTERKRAEEAIRQSEQLLKRVFASLREAVFIVDATTARIQDCNAAASGIFGYSVADMLGRTTEFLHVDEATLTEFRQSLYAAVDQKGFLFLPAFRMKRKDGSVFPTEHYVTPIEDDKGNRIGWVSVVRDITERKQAEEALRESEEKFRNLFDNALVGMFRTRLDGSQVLDVNEKVLEILGRTREEMLSMPSLAHWVDPAERQAMVRQLEAKGRVTDFECRLWTKRGEVRTCLMSFRIYSGQRMLEGSISDITERKRAEEALRESEARYRSLVEESADAIGIMLEGKLAFINSAGVRMFGARTQEELLGRKREQIIHPDDFAGAMGRILRRQKGELGVYPVEVRYVRLDGTPLPVEVSTAPITFAGEPAMQFMARDITERRRAEETLRLSEVRLKKAQEIAHLGSWEMDLVTRHLTWSDEVYRIFGMAPEDFAASYEAFLEAVHPEDRAAVDAAYARSVQEGRDTYEIEHRIVRRLTGEIRYVRERCEHIRDGAGRVLRSVGMVHDITEHKQAEQALLLANQWMGLHVKQTPLAVIEFDLAGRIREWNPAAAAIFGFSREEAIGQYWHFIVPQPVWAQLDGVWEALVTQRGGSRSTNDNCTKDGRMISCEWFNTPLIDADGQTIGVASLVQDVTERRRAEEALERHRAELQAIYEHAPVMMCVLDSDRRIAHVNRAFTEFAGIPENGLPQGRIGGVLGCINALTDPRGCGRGKACEDCQLRLAMEDTFRTGASHHDVEYRATLERDGVRRQIVLIGATAMVRTTDRSSLLLCLEDVSEQRQVQEKIKQREAELFHVSRLSTLGEMASGIAHELNQPLSAILSYGDACLRLAQSETPDVQRVVRNLQHVVSQGERAGDIVRRVRALAKHRQLDLTPVNLNEAVGTVAALVRSELANKGVQLRLELGEPLPLVSADMIQMEQVVLNLTRNAIEAMEHVEERRLTLRTMSVGGTQVRVEVCDTGVGLPADEPDRVFEPFFSTKPDGLGIGLSISRSIIQMHQGTLEAGSNADGGSTFSATLPVHEMEHPTGESPGGSGE